MDYYVSIIIPAYNAAKTIKYCIESVLNQSYQQFEIVVVDDCSTDDTVNIVREFTDGRLILLENENNAGVASTRNRGVASAKYDLIAFLDSDDMWEATKLEKQIELLKKNPDVSLFYTGSAFINENGKRKKHVLEVPKSVSYKRLLKQNVISCSSILIKKDTYNKYPMYPDNFIHEDYATWLQVLKNEKYALGINEPLLVYRISKSSKSGNKIGAAKMQWNTYQYMKLGTVEASLNFIAYACRNVVKYAKLKLKGEYDD